MSTGLNSHWVDLVQRGYYPGAFNEFIVREKFLPEAVFRNTPTYGHDYWLFRALLRCDNRKWPRASRKNP